MYGRHEANIRPVLEERGSNRKRMTNMNIVVPGGPIISRGRIRIG